MWMKRVQMLINQKWLIGKTDMIHIGLRNFFELAQGKAILGRKGKYDVKTTFFASFVEIKPLLEHEHALFCCKLAGFTWIIAGQYAAGKPGIDLVFVILAAALC